MLWTINIPGQPWELQLSVWISVLPRLPVPSDSSQSNPPFEAGGLLHVLVFDWKPPPQVTLQAPKLAGQVPQLPLTRCEINKTIMKPVCSFHSSFNHET